MITIVFQYRPVPFIPFLRKRDIAFPSSWNELTPQQLENINLVLQPGHDERKIMRLFLGIGSLFARRLDSFQRFCILRQLRFLNSIDICDRFIIPRIGKLRAPEARLKNVTFGAFIFGDTYFQNYLEGKKEDLDRFIACYYTRGEFSENNIERNALMVSGESIEKREAIALNYRLIREWLARSYEYVFQKADEKKKEKSKGWIGVFDAVVGDDIVHQDDYARQPLSQILRYLDHKTKEYYKNPQHG
jgi:hypothetical protein